MKFCSYSVAEWQIFLTVTDSTLGASLTLWNSREVSMLLSILQASISTDENLLYVTALSILKCSLFKNFLKSWHTGQRNCDFIVHLKGCNIESITECVPFLCIALLIENVEKCHTFYVPTTLLVSPVWRCLLFRSHCQRRNSRVI